MYIMEDAIINQLDLIPIKSLRKRLDREIREIISLGICSNINIMVETLNTYNPITTYNIGFTQITDNQYYEFIISTDYPFKPPKLIMNTTPYSNYFKFESDAFKKTLFRYNGMNCFCCESILCWGNWTPHYKIISILDEVKQFKQICRDISYRIIIDVIKRKYLVNDINITEWILFRP